MTKTVNVRLYLLLCLVSLHAGQLCSAQLAGLDPLQWATALSKKARSGNEAAGKLDSVLEYIDSATAFRFLTLLQEKGKSKGDGFQARFNCVFARQLFLKSAPYDSNRPQGPVNIRHIKAPLNNLFSSAMDIAYRTEDDYLVAYVSYAYAITIIRFGEIGTAVMYAKNSLDLYEKLSYDIPASQYQFLAEMLYTVREYEDCIQYSNRAALAWQRSSAPDKWRQTASCLNTVALCYHRQQRYDSAFVFYKQAFNMAKTAGSPVWMNIVSGNMAQIYFAEKRFDSAYRLFMNDSKTSRDSGLYNNAANSLQWAARTSLALGNKQRALTEVRDAFQLLKLWPEPDYLKNAYYTTAQVFRQTGKYDSAFYYDNLYAILNNSLDRTVAVNSLAIIRTRLNDMQSRYDIQKLNKEKRMQLLTMNTAIAFTVAFSLFALLLVNRKRLKTKLQNEKITQEKLLMEQEMAYARNQLSMFTQNIIDKTCLIDKLEQQLKGKATTAEHQIIISELSCGTILTEEDWTKFRSLFEIVYPGFFTKLKDKFPDITEAEKRMAALTRLHLTTRQIAFMLGISVDSVHKSRQRLRQRFRIDVATNLDEVVAAL